MDTDITPIFENDDEETQRPPTPPPPIDQPQAPDSPRRESDPREVPHIPVLKDDGEQCTTRLQDIMDPPPQPQAEYSYYPQQSQMYAPMVPPPQFHLPQQQPDSTNPKWDPFSSIGATAWVALGIAFIIGFVIGKLR